MSSRRIFEERVVLTAAVCRELQQEDAAGDLAGARSSAAYGLLTAWMRSTYGLGEYAVFEFDRYGLDEPHLSEYAPDLARELRLGGAVCDALSMVYSAGVGMEFQRDMEYLGKVLKVYLSELANEQS